MLSWVILLFEKWEDEVVKMTEDRLHSFIQLYQQEFGVLLSKSDAQRKATMLLNYVLLGLEPLAKVDESDINKELD